VRVQLGRRLALVAALGTASLAAAGSARAQILEVDTTHSVFSESPTRTNMFVYSPSASIQASPFTWLDVGGGWQADVVSGASVATKAGPAYGATHNADVVTTASVHDLRNVALGNLTLKGNSTSLTAGYSYGIEHDYQSNSINVSARTDAFQHNTQFELAYAHNFDEVCNRVQDTAVANQPTLWTALENSTGCFSSAANRLLDAISVDTYEASWNQSWTPVLETQLTYSAQLIDGFQSDPYRSVIIGEGVKAQEHVPNDRAREALTARGAYYLRSIKAAIRLSLRAYHDTWAIDSGTAELEFEKSLGESVRLMLRGRVYRQDGAVFWSDDYAAGGPPLGQKGQYWTGDRELSPFWSFLGGLRAVWTWAPTDKRILGFIQTLKLAGSASMQDFSYDQYTLAGVPVTNAIAYVGTASLTLDF
jgi:hypothetical protein